MIPMNERHLRRTLQSWVVHYNRGRPHASLGPGIPEQTSDRSLLRRQPERHPLPPNCEIKGEDILGGLHHEYRLKMGAA
jgi:hypothetical protein